MTPLNARSPAKPLLAGAAAAGAAGGSGGVGGLGLAGSSPSRAAALAAAFVGVRQRQQRYLQDAGAGPGALAGGASRT
jgi:hypothetical protein